MFGTTGMFVLFSCRVGEALFGFWDCSNFARAPLSWVAIFRATFAEDKALAALARAACARKFSVAEGLLRLLRYVRDLTRARVGAGEVRGKAEREHCGEHSRVTAVRALSGVRPMKDKHISLYSVRLRIRKRLRLGGLEFRY